MKTFKSGLRNVDKISIVQLKHNKKRSLLYRDLLSTLISVLNTTSRFSMSTCTRNLILRKNYEEINKSILNI